MKQAAKKAAALCLAFILALAMIMPLGAGRLKVSAANTYKDAGYYTLSYFEEDGEEIDISFLAMLGVEIGLVLDKDGTGFIYYTNEIEELTWYDGLITMDGEDTEYTVKNGTLHLEESDSDIVMEFVKSTETAPTRKEVAAMKTLDERLESGEISEDDVLEMFGGYLGEDVLEGDGEEDDYEPRDIVAVSTVEALMTSLVDNTTVYLMPGTYNITEWLDSQKKLPSWNEDKIESLSEGIYKEEVFDGDQAVLFDIDGLTITSMDKNNPAEIVIEPRYANVFAFRDCDDLVIDSVVLGHTPDEGSCTGNVIDLNFCYHVNIRGCELYGCGAYALTMDSCYNVNVEDCDIHDCTYGCADIYYTDLLTFSRCDFHNCREFTMFSFNDCTEINFVGCSFKKLDGDLFSAGSSDVFIMMCDFDRAARRSLEENEEYGENITVIDDFPEK